MILAMGFRSSGENYEFSGDVAKLKKASKVIETAIEPMQHNDDDRNDHGDGDDGDCLLVPLLVDALHRKSAWLQSDAR